MKQLFAILFLTIFLFACDKEKAIIDVTPDFPDSVTLVENNINGNLKNNTNQAIDQGKVNVHYQEYILGTTTTTSTGSFELQDQPIHEKNSYISFTKDGYSPNYYSSNIQNNSTLSLSPVLKPWIIDQDYDLTAQTIQISDMATVNMKETSILIYTPVLPKVKIQFLDFSQESSDLLLAKRTKTEDLNFSHAFYIDIIDEGISTQLIPTLDVVLTINNTTIQNLEDDFWWFDNDLGYWVNAGQLSFDGTKYNVPITNGGYYAFSSTCSPDLDPPTPYCFTGQAIHFPDLNDASILASDIDFNSFDNCDMDLDFEIRRSNDPCGNGSDEFASSLDFCPSDDGLSIDIVLKVTDDAMNSDSCFTVINVTGDTIPNNGCAPDLSSPIPYCVSISTLVYQAGAINMVYAVDFNIGSYDNCTLDDDLIYKIKKVTDICQNGSDQLEETVTICDAEIGTTINLEMHVFDEQNNSDYCTVSMSIVQ